MRHELKYLVCEPSARILKSVLSASLRFDPHYPNGTYSVCSLYFDDLSRSAYTEKTDGAPEREKFRIRLYDSDDSYIVLEKKYKKNDLVDKRSFLLDRAAANALIGGEYIEGNDSLLKEFISKRTSEGLCPSMVVKYERTAFVFPFENTRITIDESVRFSQNAASLFDPDASFIPLPNEAKTIVEIKYDNAFPSFLVPILSSVPTERTAFSKYALTVGAMNGSYI